MWFVVWVGDAANNMDHFHSLMYKKLDDILAATCPRKSVQFALDGPAPLAKLLTQRARRKVTKLSFVLSLSSLRWC